MSTGYNCEQALAGFLPVAEGTMVFYVNRTSTDQVTGFGGGMKRDLGSTSGSRREASCRSGRSTTA